MDVLLRKSVWPEPRRKPRPRVFVALRGPIRGRPLWADGLDEILDGVRRRTGL